MEISLGPTMVGDYSIDPTSFYWLTHPASKVSKNNQFMILVCKGIKNLFVKLFYKVCCVFETCTFKRSTDNAGRCEPISINMGYNVDRSVVFNPFSALAGCFEVLPPFQTLFSQFPLLG